MAKKIRFNTISLGSEPDQPDICALSGFISSNRGIEADLISFKLVSSLTAQQEAGIFSLCAGGLFQLSRFETAIISSQDEYHGDPSLFIIDAELIIKTAGRIQSALPAPDLIPLCPNPSDEERYADFCDIYASLLRCMRDMQISGHILHTKKVCPIDIERIASQKTFFIYPDGNLESQETLLEFQDRIALNSNRVKMLKDLIDQYDIKSLTILDPEQDGFQEALKYLDPDQITVGGYGKGTEEEYWRKISDSATTSLNQE